MSEVVDPEEYSHAKTNMRFLGIVEPIYCREFSRGETPVIRFVQINRPEYRSSFVIDQFRSGGQTYRVNITLNKFVHLRHQLPELRNILLVVRDYVITVRMIFYAFNAMIYIV